MNRTPKRQRQRRFLALSLGFACTLVFAAHARAATANIDRQPTTSRSLLLAVTAPALADSARRDFELNVTRGLRFSGLDVVAESTGGAALTLAACSDPGCLRETGSARGVMALVRANVDAPVAEPRDGSKRNYSIKVELFSASTGQSVVAKEAGCAGCTSGVATHLAYLLAAEVGQKFARDRHPIAAVASPTLATPAASGARTAMATPAAVAAATPAPATAAVATSGDPTLLAHRDRVTKVGAGILGGLGAAALTTGAVLLLRGPQSTCPDLPASACGRTYDDSPTGWLLAGTGAAAIAGAILWATWPEPKTSDSTSSRVAIVPGGLLAAPGSVVVNGRF